MGHNDDCSNTPLMDGEIVDDSVVEFSALLHRRWKSREALRSAAELRALSSARTLAGLPLIELQAELPSRNDDGTVREWSALTHTKAPR